MQVSDYIASKYGQYDPFLNIDEADNHHLLSSILIGNKTESKFAMSERIIRNYGFASLVNEKDPVKLNNLLCVGLHNAKRIVALFELGRRVTAPVKKGITLIRGPEDVYNLMSFTKSHLKESFYGLYLNTRNIVITQEVVAVGHLGGCLVHPREVFMKAIEYNAHHVIVVHNHPSGEFEPSKEDDEITRILKESGEILQIPLTDHVVIAENGYYSYSKERRL